MMTDNELRKLAQMIVEAQASNPTWMLENAKAHMKLRKKDTEPRWVNTKVAAQMLGLSVRTMRDIKDSFCYIKSGNENQSNIYFDANKLMDGYDKYLASRRKAGSSCVAGVVGM